MASYDFNATYGPLPVHDQGDSGACWYYAHGLALVAAAKMHGLTIGWTDPDFPPFSFDGGKWRAAFSDGVHTVTPMGSVDLADRAAVCAYLDGAGVACLAVSQPSSLNVWASSTLPVVRPVAGDSDDGGHDLLVVGYTDQGLLVQNSWGPAYGFRGRAVLSWEWLAVHGKGLDREVYDDYPLLGATRPPCPLKGTKMLLARRSATSPVFAFAGGVRSWIQSRAVLPAQGLSMDDVVVVDPTDAVWKCPIVGPVPPGGDS